MKPLLPKRNHWPTLALVALAVVFAGNEAARGQRGGQPRPGGFQPGRPPGPVGAPGQRQRQPFIPQPFVPQQRPMPPVVQTIIVYSCSNCNTQLGSGPVPPALAQCPVCGARFVNGNGHIVARAVPAPAPPLGVSSTFVYTLEIEGALLAGMVLVGLVRLVNDRRRTPAPAEAEG